MPVQIDHDETNAGREPSRAARPKGAPTWWVIATRELADLWLSGKAPALMLAFCIVQWGLIYFKVADVTDPTPPKELIYFTLMNAISIGVFMSIIIGADAISGERERLTLEALLLTPGSRRQIVVGKFLAGCSPWIAALAVTVPLVIVIAQGDEVVWTALFWGLAAGTLLASSFAALGMVVSFWSGSNPRSLFVSLVLYFCFLFPTWLPGGAQAGIFGRLLKRANPLESVGHWLEKTIVNNRPPLEFSTDPRGGGSLWLLSPILLAVLTFGILFLYAGPELSLDAGDGAFALVTRFRRRRQKQESAAQNEAAASS